MNDPHGWKGHGDWPGPEEGDIEVGELDAYLLLAELYNDAQPVGMGKLHWTPARMTREEAAELIIQRSMGVGRGPTNQFDPKTPWRFDYLNGRSMKVDLTYPAFNPRPYDRDSGKGAAQRVVDRVRKAMKI